MSDMYSSSMEYNEAATHLTQNETLAGAVIRLAAELDKERAVTSDEVANLIALRKAEREERKDYVKKLEKELRAADKLAAERLADMEILASQQLDLEARYMRATASADKPLPTVNSPWRNDNQQGGEHYKSLVIDPTTYICENGLSWCQGNAIKYITRHQDKGYAGALLKAMHYIQLMLWAEYQCRVDFSVRPEEATGVKDAPKRHTVSVKYTPGYPPTTPKHMAPFVVQGYPFDAELYGAADDTLAKVDEALAQAAAVACELTPHTTTDAKTWNPLKRTGAPDNTQGSPFDPSKLTRGAGDGF